MEIRKASLSKTALIEPQNQNIATKDHKAEYLFESILRSL